MMVGLSEPIVANNACAGDARPLLGLMEPDATHAALLAHLEDRKSACQRRARRRIPDATARVPPAHRRADEDDGH